jgi:hypothetical protein
LPCHIFCKGRKSCATPTSPLNSGVRRLRPMSKRLVFSFKTLLTFVLVGPLIAWVGMGGLSEPITLILAYPIGAFFAVLAWSVYSTALSLLQCLPGAPVTKNSIAILLWKIVVSIFFGAASGFVVWAIPTCSISGWVLGGFTSCMKVSFFRDYYISVLPGLISGLVSVFTSNGNRA